MSVHSETNVLDNKETPKKAIIGIRRYFDIRKTYFMSFGTLIIVLFSSLRAS